jgi:hypothetical protein
MRNFVMLDMPNFILIREDEPLRCNDALPTFLNTLFGEILIAAGVRDEAWCESDSVRFFRIARPMMRLVARKYGFERLPRTLGELCGLFDYCDRLDVIAGSVVFEAEHLAQWRQLMHGWSQRRTSMPYQHAVDLYRAGNTIDLLAWHTDNDVLSKLGRSYRWVPR